MELLEYHPDLSALFPQWFPFKGGDFHIPDPYPPPVRSFQQVNAPDQRRFSGSWISDYAEDFSFFICRLTSLTASTCFPFPRKVLLTFSKRIMYGSFLTDNQMYKKTAAALFICASAVPVLSVHIRENSACIPAYGRFHAHFIKHAFHSAHAHTSHIRHIHNKTICCMHNLFPHPFFILPVSIRQQRPAALYSISPVLTLCCYYNSP